MDNRRKFQEPEWIPKTLLGKLVKSQQITASQIFKHNIPIKEVQIIDFLFPDLQEKVMLVKSIQKQTKAGQRTRIKVLVAVGSDGYIGIGTKAAKELQQAIRGATLMAKINLRPIKKGFWGETFGDEHTVCVKTSAKVGSVTLQIIPAPKGSGLVAAPSIKPLFALCGIKDCFTRSKGNTSTTENFINAAFQALSISSDFFTPKDWEEVAIEINPLFQTNIDLQTQIQNQLSINN